MNILLIEDDSILNDTITGYLNLKGNLIKSLEDGLDAINIINQFDFDLYIIDINIPHINGLEIVKHIRQKDSDSPIIMITASMEFKHFKSAYKNGCDDFIKKPFRLEELEMRIGKLIEKKNEVKRIEQLNVHLEKMANFDSLTGIRNRRCFSELLKDEAKRSKRHQNTLSLIYLDIDYFKKINDSFGHKSGDNILIKVVKVVLSQLREIDIFGRWGGEEFLILLPETNLNDAVYV